MERQIDMKRRFGRATAVGIAALAIGGYIGYRHPAAKPVKGTVHRARAIAAGVPALDLRGQGIAQAQATSLYRQAQRACGNRQYRLAADLLSQLAGQSDISPDAADFVAEQREVCLRDAGDKPQPAARRHGAMTETPVMAARRPLTAEQADCGPRALALVCDQLGIKATLPVLRRRAGTTGKGTSFAGLEAAAKAVGLKVEGVQVSREALPEVETPALAYINGNHFAALLGLHGRGEAGTATLHDPNTPRDETISQERLLRLSGGYLLLVHR